MRKLKILVIDDMPMRARDFVRQGHDVRVAHGFEQVKFWIQEVAREWKPDIVFLDHDMPQMNGVDVIQTFASDLLPYPIVIWTTNSAASTQMYLKLLEAGTEHNTLAQVCQSPYSPTRDHYLPTLEYFFPCESTTI
jgi:CheY-like chemotaxis protein